MARGVSHETRGVSHFLRQPPPHNAWVWLKIKRSESCYAGFGEPMFPLLRVQVISEYRLFEPQGSEGGAGGNGADWNGCWEAPEPAPERRPR